VLSGQLSKRVSIFVQFGQNNFNYCPQERQARFCMMPLRSMLLFQKKLSIGFGLNGWNGLGRFSNSSVASILVWIPHLSGNYQ